MGWESRDVSKSFSSNSYCQWTISDFFASFSCNFKPLFSGLSFQRRNVYTRVYGIDFIKKKGETPPWPLCAPYTNELGRNDWDYCIRCHESAIKEELGWVTIVGLRWSTHGMLKVLKVPLSILMSSDKSYWQIKQLDTCWPTNGPDRNKGQGHSTKQETIVTQVSCWKQGNCGRDSKRKIL